MNGISDSLRLIIWFSLCVFMAVGMLVFALVYTGVSFVGKKLAWKQFSFPSVKIAR